MDQQRGLNVAAPVFTPSKFSGEVHSSQPNIGRRASCNPTFVTPTKQIRRGTSMRAGNGNTFGRQLQQNGQEENVRKGNSPDAKKKELATSFANEAFARKDAMKAFAAKKLAAQRANTDRVCETREERINRELPAQKGGTNRQSLKLKKKNGKRNSQKFGTIPVTHSTSSDSKISARNEHQENADKENNPQSSSDSATNVSSTSQTPPSPPASTSITNNPVSSNQDPSPSVRLADSETNSPDKRTISSATISEPDNESRPTISSVTDIDSTPAKSMLSLESVAPLTIQQSSEPTSEISRLSTISATPKSLSRVPTCDVEISAMPRISAVSTPGPPVQQQVISTSSGKWCPSCAGVGLHISALLTELAKQQRVDTVARPSNTASASGSLGSSWKRRMSQTIIGDRGAGKALAEQKRLQQQVDVLTTTVAFLYEKLQSADIADQYVDDAFNRCCIER